MARFKKNNIRKSIALSLGILAAVGLQGCGESQGTDQQAANTDNGIETLQGDLQQQNYFLVIEQTAAEPDKYVLAEKHETSGDTRAVLKKLDGSEVILSNDELKALAEAEAAKVEAGTSALTQEASAESSGMGLGEMVLASAAGALIGGMLANKLSGNSNFQRNQQANTRPAAAVTQKAKTRQKPSVQQRAKPQPRTQSRKRKGFSFGRKRR